MRNFYHGTNLKAADCIRCEGFRPDSWFAVHMEDAISCGGPVVFTVSLDVNRLEDEDGEFWQFHILAPVGVDAIVGEQWLALNPLHVTPYL